MTEIPSSWPPDPTPETTPVLPLFALPRFWLFPNVILPLNIFEERYKQMVEDHLDGPGRIVLGTVLTEHEGELEGSPPIHSIAGLGEIGRHDRLEDGCYRILLVGLGRVRITETESERLYRRVFAESVEEIDVPAESQKALREQLMGAIAERTEDTSHISPKAALSYLADLLILRMPMAPDDIQMLYAELDVEERAQRALEQHERLPEMPQPPPGWSAREG